MGEQQEKEKSVGDERGSLLVYVDVASKRSWLSRVKRVEAAQASCSGLGSGKCNRGVLKTKFGTSGRDLSRGNDLAASVRSSPEDWSVPKPLCNMQ